ncbi:MULTISPECIES: propionyl-CoA synthetase [Marinobacter]|jgi:propionyl-CoA synthetase|uniref:Acetyl-coenzyme A synthetase n=3 Tax=Marinobacter TaxID=2742 RepID=W5YSR7_9GAMM|nr:MULTISPECIES: propionyl-CoA synthetase [Marinobacter]AHI31894.1 acyl-CoA synthetase [Marinobacter salarius]ARM83889.1 acetyl-coenzyme A synthetase [Marinobacter salarius]MCC4282455.1 propionyl-CoA synthetase [Marinobacter salarius]MDM8178195.1 propionyl-CoA synthetase [Marinobacter salarius]MDP4532417.1 propionyl-CoA synthetase [Marinobacter salarius]|tara:strand:+ start:862 stop:2736 length:1875 start_codon:yes stop_codon:yes gene_type:complete
MDYHSEFRQSIDQPDAFWREKASAIDWMEPPKTIWQPTDNGHGEWFPDGVLNTSDIALDANIRAGRGEQKALIYDSPVTGTTRSYTYNELTREVATFAGALQDRGITKGDRVILYMPMIPEAVIAMLGCARIGAIHSVVFGGFASNELAVRIDDAKPKAVITASCGIEVSKVIEYKPLVDKAIDQADHKPECCIVFQRPQAQATLQEGRDFDWGEMVSRARAVDPVPVRATDPLYILYTSGTTGKPKGVVRDNGGHAVALRYSMHLVYDASPGDVYWAASDVGWVVGHSYIVYAPLFAGCTTILYEGKPVKTPDAGAFWRVVQDHGVNLLFTAPTAFRAVRKEDPEADQLSRYDISSLKRLFLAGERLDPPTYEWLKEHTRLPILDHWWQTETGWAICCNPVGIEMMTTKPGSATLPSPGFNVQVVDMEGHQVPAGEQGQIAVKLPLPPGCMSTVWGDDARFRNTYLAPIEGFYSSGDGGFVDEDGYVFVMGRTDDVINVAGHRLSTGEMEEVVAAHPAIAECCVVGAHDDMRGQVPVGLVLIKDGATIDHDELEEELVEMVREKIGAIACFRKALVVERLPKTRSGKILRRVIRQIADGEDYAVPSTIDDPAILEEISEQFKS